MQGNHLEDTIVAVATPRGEGAIGIIRLSGTLALQILRETFRTRSGGTSKSIHSHRMMYGQIMDSHDSVLDEVLAIYMKAPRTYTREDIVEIHCHGGTAAIESIVQEVLQRGVRLARPGEYTYRAYINGRIDLTQAEAVVDVIHARTRKSLRHASEQLAGALGQRMGELKDLTIRLLAHVEAYIDFPDEEIPDLDLESFKTSASSLSQEVTSLLETYRRGRIFREGVSVAIVGRPNVGKSSLLNLLLAEDRAIVTDLPGTTRDTIEESLSINGLPVRLIDTAGIREGHDLAEMEGVRRSRLAMENAELVLLVLDKSQSLHTADMDLLDASKNLPCLVVLNKSDLPSGMGITRILEHRATVNVSARTGEGLQCLRDEIERTVLRDSDPSEGIMITRLRHQEALEVTRKGLAEFLSGLEGADAPEILALDLREALNGLDDIMGVTTAQDVLDTIFSDFCIGK